MSLGGRGYRDSVARWLRAAMLDERGRNKMSITELIKKSKTGRTSVYRILGAQADTEPETLLRLAAALKVPPPRVELVLRLDEPDTPLTLPTLAKLKEAAALIQEAVDAIEADARPDAAAAAARDHRHVARLGPAAHQPKSPKDRSA